MSKEFSDCRNKESVAAQISTRDDMKDMIKKKTTELMKISLDWSLPTGEVSNDITLKLVFFTKGGQAVCESSQPLDGKNSDSTP